MFIPKAPGRTGICHPPSSVTAWISLKWPHASLLSFRKDSGYLAAGDCPEAAIDQEAGAGSALVRRVA